MIGMHASIVYHSAISQGILSRPKTPNTVLKRQQSEPYIYLQAEYIPDKTMPGIMLLPPAFSPQHRRQHPCN